MRSNIRRGTESLDIHGLTFFGSDYTVGGDPAEARTSSTTGETIDTMLAVRIHQSLRSGRYTCQL